MPSTLGPDTLLHPVQSVANEESESLPLYNLSASSSREDSSSLRLRNPSVGTPSVRTASPRISSDSADATTRLVSAVGDRAKGEKGEEEEEEDDEDYDEKRGLVEDGMPRRQSSRLRAQRDGTASATSSRASTPAPSNGHTKDVDMISNGSVEMRRKNMSFDTEQRTSLLMARESFTLDDDPLASSVPGLGQPQGVSSFFDLPTKDKRNFLFLVLLYFVQGVPMGLANGSVPFLLKSTLSYGQIGVYTLAGYPYSLKLFWSPIVDAVWSPWIGRRKSWILPIQLCSGMGMLYLGSQAKRMMADAAKSDGSGIWIFTAWWFGVVLMCATQDIAVDGWALTLLSQENLSFASTAQTVGLTAGQFISYTIFLALNSKDFANRYFRKVPGDEGLITLTGYLTFCGWIYIIITIGVALLKREDKTKERDGIISVYKSMWSVLKLRNIHTFIIVHLIAKIGFQANDAATNLKLLDKGFSQEDMALAVLIDFPFEIGLGYLAGSWSSKYQPLNVWRWGFMARLVAALFAQVTVMAFPKGGTTPGYLFLVILEHVYSTFTNTVMFVAISAFHAKIADPVIGGTYMTLLATASNLGGTYPRYPVLKLVDALTIATCEPFVAEHPGQTPDTLKKGAKLITEAFSCAIESEKRRCIDGGGTCNVQRDGFYITNVVCVVFGVITFFLYIQPAVKRLQALPLRVWRIRDDDPRK